MRKAAIIFLVIGLAALLVAFYPAAMVKPEKDGSGPLSVRIDARFAAPEYHSPLEWWQMHHFEAVNNGDISQDDCLYCHDPAISCNNCHAYVGANPIVKTAP